MYGVKRGSKKPRLHEYVNTQRRLTVMEAQNRYDSIQKGMREAAREAKRFVVVTGFIEGVDDIPSELVTIKNRYDSLRSELQLLIDSYPEVR